MIWEDLIKQEVISPEISLGIDGVHSLNGSAEQSILHYFKNKTIKEELLLYSKNQCFRNEYPKYKNLLYCKEFVKLEQFCFTTPNNWEKNFNLLLNNATSFLEKYKINYRIVDVTNRDAGYHKFKKDIEIFTESFGWIETHSCSFFEKEQMKRFNISGDFYTISNTGIASPRILIPFIEKDKTAKKILKSK